MKKTLFCIDIAIIGSDDKMRWWKAHFELWVFFSFGDFIQFVCLIVITAKASTEQSI